MEIVSDFETRASQSSENRDNQKYDYANLSIFNSPILSTKVFFFCTLDLSVSTFKFIGNQVLPIATISVAILTFFYIPGPHEEVSKFHS